MNAVAGNKRKPATAGTLEIKVRTLEFQIAIIHQPLVLSLISSAL